MDKPLLALPYHGPSCSVDVLERVAKRDLLRCGKAWSDLPFAEQNARLDDARVLLRDALKMVLTDPTLEGLSFFPTRSIRTYRELDDLIGALRYLESAHYSRAMTAGFLNRALRVQS